MSKVTLGELRDEAATQGIDPDQSYEDLREQLDIHTCRECGDEYLTGYSEKFCTDTCEVRYRSS